MPKPRKIDARFYACRAFGHKWAFTFVKRNGDVLIQGLGCERGCGAEKTVGVDRDGRINRRHSRHLYRDTDYLLHGGPMTVTERAHCRLSEVKAHLR